MSDFRGFTPALFGFLRELSENNDREWFEANKARYEADVREPARAFIRAMGPHVTRFSPAFVADDRKVGGSLMRVHRDTRFSKDKTPYKTNVGIQFRHSAGKDVHAPGLYVHLAPDSVFLGAGLWHPEASALARIRARIDEDGKTWKRVTSAKKLRDAFERRGDSLKRAPKGFSPDHPFIDDLRLKDHIAIADLSPKAAVGPGFTKLVADRFRASRDFVGFLCGAVGVDF